MAQPVLGESADGAVAAVKGENTGSGGFGVLGISATGHGVHGQSIGSKGVVGESQRFHGVFGKSQDNVGVAAESQNAEAMNARSHSGVHAAIIAINDANGVGIQGTADGNVGVLGESNTGRGIRGTSNTHIGVSGDSQLGQGVRGTSVRGRGTEGFSTALEGVAGISQQSTGVLGVSRQSTGVLGIGEERGTGVIGQSASGIGVHGKGGLMAGLFEGNVEVTGNIELTGPGSDLRLRNADCAEDFDVFGITKVDPGTVMVLAEEGTLFESREAYDKRVAGVVSGAGDYRPAIVLDGGAMPGNRQPIALMGKVFCKVDAQFGTIKVGDLLTTSPTPGHAMVVSEPARAFGTTIGKALRPLSSGTGLIPILVALQ